MVTKTGTNDFHGSVGTYLSADFLDAGRRPTVRIDPTDDTRAETVTYPEDDYSTWEPGFTLGGPSSGTDCGSSRRTSPRSRRRSAP